MDELDSLVESIQTESELSNSQAAELYNILEGNILAFLDEIEG